MSSQQSELASQYRPADVEPDMLERWVESRAHHADPDAEGEPYSIVIPPPNVTAALHLGHALNNTLQDILIRYHRMRGENTLWMPGTDHAGIATQTVVDKRLQQEGEPSLKDYKQMEARGESGRERFIEKVQAWKDEYEQRITDQLKRMGCSCDWDRQRFTMDPVCARAVREAFFRLFKDGLIYRGKRLVNWDPVSQTALADDEVEMREVDGQFWYMKYPVVDEAGAETGDHVTVATTRPETMLGDTAVAVNPKDAERAGYIGKRVLVPIVNRVVPVVGDDYVTPPDAESGDVKAQYASGFLKVTPAHDPNDYEIGFRHEDVIAQVAGQVLINVMGPDASISHEYGWPANDLARGDDFLKEELLGLSREAARKAIVRWFKERGLLADQRPYKHSVGHSYRSHVAVEPWLSDQWYVAVSKAIDADAKEAAAIGQTDVPGNSLAGLALRAMAEDQRGVSAKRDQEWEGHLRFYPERYAKGFEHWHENIRDWCISRQLWWGHRIPVWTLTFDNLDSGDPRPSSLEHEKWVVELVADIARAAKVDGELSVRRDGATVFYLCARTEKASKLCSDIEAFVRSYESDKESETTKYVLSKVPEFEEVSDLVGKLAGRLMDIQQDPDVLDTWFSSALWPLSTMGWPEPGAFGQEFPEGEKVLAKWNPTNTLCTAREIITLWVSRMVMFNLYFSDPQRDEKSAFQRLPFYDVFVHAMIQDGHGQKMSKSLGNGVDPMDIIHSHGSDAMRFTLAHMTTQTQDVRLPVDLICPFTGEIFEPAYVSSPGGYKVMAPEQTCPSDKSKTMVSSYGVSSGKVQASDERPLARNTSSKFDQGRNFANKLWNAVRFALSALESADGVDPQGELMLADRWLLSRLSRAVQSANRSLQYYEFSQYAQGLYDFVWRDFCDWYIEAVKPTVGGAGAAGQRAVLAAGVDASLRLLHPVMPFVTEKLWANLNAIVPERSVGGIELPRTALLMQARWPHARKGCVDEKAERTFGKIQQVVAGIRQVRTQHTVPPRQTVELSADAPAALAATLLEHDQLIETLGNVACREIGPRVEKPADAAVAVTADVELYLHGLVDPQKERERLSKRKAELERQIKTLEGRLSNENYVSKAPAKLVEESREQLAGHQRELQSIEAQLGAVG